MLCTVLINQVLCIDMAIKIVIFELYCCFYIAKKFNTYWIIQLTFTDKYLKLKWRIIVYYRVYGIDKFGVTQLLFDLLFT